MKSFKKYQDETIHQCPQENCAYRNNGCKKCGECDCKPHYIDENCDRCLNCCRIENTLRWDESQELTEEQIKEIFQKLLDKLMLQAKQNEKEKKQEKAVNYVG